MTGSMKRHTPSVLAAALLKYVDGGFYTQERFHRATRAGRPFYCVVFFASGALAGFGGRGRLMLRLTPFQNGSTLRSIS
jgi:hypothetical protein